MTATIESRADRRDEECNGSERAVLNQLVANAYSAGARSPETVTQMLFFRFGLIVNSHDSLVLWSKEFLDLLL